jgi:hypothetical protein
MTGVQQSITGPTIPTALLNLPVTKRLADIDFECARFVAKAATGGGKSMVLPPYEARIRKARGETVCMAMRVPTKVVGQWLTAGLDSLWGPLGVKVAQLNRDIDDEAAKRCLTADIVVISDGSLGRLMKMRKVTHYILDEAHHLSLNCELDLSVAKISGMFLRLLSATIDEAPFMEYLGPGAKCYTLEGRSFPITDDAVWASPEVFKRGDHEELFAIVKGIVDDLKRTGESALLFLPTRVMTETFAEKFADDLPTTFIHGGVSPVEAEAWVKKHEGASFLALCTTAAAMGITISLDRSYIADEKVDSVEERGMTQTVTGKMDDNLLLQARGRCGRLRPGKAVLITHEGHRNADRDPWLDVQPRAVVPPSEKSTPFEVILTAAQHGITRDEDIDILGVVNEKEMKFARGWLIRNGCLHEDGTLTKIGRLVASFPMGVQHGHLILTGRCLPCTQGVPSELRCVRCIKVRLVLLSAFTFGLQGSYSLCFVKPRSKQLAAIREKDHAWPLFPAELLHHGSVPMTMAKLAKAALGMGNDELFEWAKANNLNAKVLFAARKDFIANSTFILKDGGKRSFVATDLDDADMADSIHAHLKRHPLYRKSTIHGDQEKRSPPAFFDSVFSDGFGLAAEPEWWDCWGIQQLVRSPRFTFYSIEMGFLEPYKPAEQQTTKET